jgi:hypothetical protein
MPVESLPSFHTFDLSSASRYNLTIAHTLPSTRTVTKYRILDTMPNPPRANRVRIGNVSGATGDSPTAMSRMAASGQVDIITGDWLSEMNIAWNAIAKSQDSSLGYEAGFLVQLEESLDDIVRNGIKVVTNAGALNTMELTRRVEEMCRKRGHGLVVAAVLGDDISSNMDLSLQHLDHPEWTLAKLGLEPYCGVAYIGCWGIVEALEQGADIVICGRVTDASPVIGAAAWWHGWGRGDFDPLARALVAGREFSVNTLSVKLIVFRPDRMRTLHHWRQLFRLQGIDATRRSLLSDR